MASSDESEHTSVSTQGAANSSCSICLEAVKDGAERSITKLVCGHRFHLDCIGSAFNAKGYMQCPNCRQVEKGNWLYGDRHQSETSWMGNLISTIDYNEDSESAAAYWLAHNGRMIRRLGRFSRESAPTALPDVVQPPSACRGADAVAVAVDEDGSNLETRSFREALDFRHRPPSVAVQDMLPLSSRPGTTTMAERSIQQRFFNWDELLSMTSTGPSGVDSLDNGALGGTVPYEGYHLDAGSLRGRDSFVDFLDNGAVGGTVPYERPPYLDAGSLGGRGNLVNCLENRASGYPVPYERPHLDSGRLRGSDNGVRRRHVTTTHGMHTMLSNPDNHSLPSQRVHFTRRLNDVHRRMSVQAPRDSLESQALEAERGHVPILLQGMSEAPYGPEAEVQGHGLHSAYDPGLSRQATNRTSAAQGPSQQFPSRKDPS